ncbi:hypothetical protein [Nocardioides speluncae]|uniref:hypothetical protein n=1 Tax=Nocardioides speluncae TaxID=2670337 RepID=UPI000D694136|nr:hypothetical protein [Nocardioides speluncae]
MHRIITGVLAALTALLLAATLAPAQAAAAADKSLTVSTVDGRRASCEADTDVPEGERNVQICINQTVGTSFNFFGKVKPHGKFKPTRLQYRPIKKVGAKWVCRLGVKWQDTRRDRTDDTAFYTYKGVTKPGCYRVKVVPGREYLRSFSMAYIISPR